ncbi:hypothetical protein MUK70_05485 [Dyadobacter chenwenxiniae]|uniref:Uncharacterized protein n=1 Tax=Dyadobacter chenwenxiniae TaxID=2906456 RepID=A0A9X1TG98_9BACT|nr:hypothetical protein [Dyadobacter chenwenxiniae]MCF0065291.1 hypothetical protein [Dyadobacter chenwenxiniae]UON84441.1 hypothetical protein MUK70_05485 [Dyadobacter chenwenxiniae]
MKNFQLMTVLLAFLLSLLFYESIAQKNDLAYAGQTAVQHDAFHAIASASAGAKANPLTAQFAVLPKITVKDDGKVFVYIFNPNRIGINVCFYDGRGHALHRDKTAARYYGKLLDVSELEAGSYELTLHSGKVSAHYTLEIAAEAREINMKGKPYFAVSQ